MTVGDPESRLAALNRRVADSLRKLGEPAPAWPATPAGVDTDVLIVGAGQCGLAAAFGLKRVGVANVRVVSADAVGQEGPWRSFARMPTLRSPKEAPGPELGLPDLVYESWHTARYGQASYDALDLIPTQHWARYIDWFKQATGIVVEQNRRLVGLDGDAMKVAASFDDGERIVARQVVLAMGMDAMGAPTCPETFQALPVTVCFSCYGEIDFDAFAGRRVAVVGAASTAFDNAATALEQGAGAVDLYCRDARLKTLNYMKGVADYGAVAHWADFDMATRWRLARHGMSRSAPPTLPTVSRACRWPNFRILLEAKIERATAARDGVEIMAAGVARSYDAALIATGYGIDTAVRPELARIFQHMARWRDRYAPPPDDVDATLGAYPFLTPGFAFTERTPGAAPWLGRVRLFAGPATASVGRITGESGNLKYGAPRLVRAITEALATEDREALIANAKAYDAHETTFEDYAANAVPASTPDAPPPERTGSNRP